MVLIYCDEWMFFGHGFLDPTSMLNVGLNATKYASDLILIQGILL